VTLIGLDFLLLLIFKVGVTALVVVAISAAVEHSGPVVGGVLMGLPITAGPGYVFLAIEATPHFVAQSALFSFAIVSANMIYVAIYIVAVRHFREVATTAICLAGWLACALFVRAAPSSLWTGLGLNSVLFIASIPLIRAQPSPLRRLRRMADRRELLLRALGAGALVAIVVTTSETVGSSITGIAMLFPVTLVTIGWIMRSRYGAEEAISVMTGALIALPGFGLSIMMLYLLAERTSVPTAMAVCLLMSLSWAMATLWFRRVTGRP
jgi:uncharacterized membrane protein (GlpM family)